MNRRRFIYPLGLLIRAVMLNSSQAITMFPSRPIITIPSSSDDLMPGVPLLCGLEPDTLTPGINYTTRWMLPRGTIVNSTSTGRFIFSESLVSIEGRSLPGTVLVVTELSYLDAGMYICEGRSTASGASTQWAAASFELQLNLVLLSNTSTLTATVDDNTVALHCEVRAYIRPDSSLIWEGPGGRRISGGTGKHQITFSDGSPDAAANGGGVLVPSRVSTLTITNPEPSDAGIYTCSVMGTSEAVTIELMVNGSVSITDSSTSRNDNKPQYYYNIVQQYTVQGTMNILVNTDTTDADTTDADTTDANTTDRTQRNSTVIILGSMIAILTGLLVITAVVICCLIPARNKSIINNNGGARSDPEHYDYVAVHGLDHKNCVCTHSVQPDESTATRTDAIANDEISDDLTVERYYDEITDDHHNTVTYDMIKELDNIMDVTKINVDTTINSEMNGACSMTRDGINTSEKSEVYGIGTTDSTDSTEMDLDAYIAENIMDLEENRPYDVATDVIDAMERNIAYGMADAIMETNEAYGVATDGIGADHMERNIAYDTTIIQEDSDAWACH